MAKYFYFWFGTNYNQLLKTWNSFFICMFVLVTTHDLIDVETLNFTEIFIQAYSQNDKLYLHGVYLVIFTFLSINTCYNNILANIIVVSIEIQFWAFCSANSRLLLMVNCLGYILIFQILVRRQVGRGYSEIQSTIFLSMCVYVGGCVVWVLCVYTVYICCS